MEEELDRRVNYKEMYLRMTRAMEKAINILIAAQQACEEEYVDAAESVMGAKCLEKLLQDRSLQEPGEEELAEENWSCYLD